MKPVLVLSILLISFKALPAADEPAPPATEGADAVRPAVPAIRTRPAIRRLPAATLRRPEAAGTATFAARAPVVDLAGNWLLTLPAGYQSRVTIEALGENRYRFVQSPGAFRGVYQLNGDVLQIVEPSDERLNVMDWQLHNANSMTLVDETGANGARYAGATLGRQIEADAELPHQVTRIGRPAVPRSSSTTRARAVRPAVPVSRSVTLTGIAFNDEEHGPYLETETTIVFLTGLDAWPEGIIGQSVRVTGAISRFLIQDQGESLAAQRLAVESWSRAEEAESNEESPDGGF